MPSLACVLCRSRVGLRCLVLVRRRACGLCNSVVPVLRVVGSCAMRSVVGSCVGASCLCGGCRVDVVLRTGVEPVVGREPSDKSPTCLAGPKRVPLLE